MGTVVKQEGKRKADKEGEKGGSDIRATNGEARIASEISEITKSEI